jgi:hypothetical protein
MGLESLDVLTEKTSEQRPCFLPLEHYLAPTTIFLKIKEKITSFLTYHQPSHTDIIQNGLEMVQPVKCEQISRVLFCKNTKAAFLGFGAHQNYTLNE